MAKKKAAVKVSKSSPSSAKKTGKAKPVKKTSKKTTKAPKTAKKKTARSAATGEAPQTAKEKADAFVKKMAASQKFRGTTQVCLPSDFASPYHLRRPTGVMGLDLALAGGLHAGGGVQVFGAGSSGKTHLAFRAAGQVQKNYGKDACVVVACTEIRLDKGFARNAGFCVAYSQYEIDQFNIIRKAKGLPPFTAEERADLKKQIGQVIVVTGETGDKVLDGTVEVLRDLGSACQLLIIESLGALLTPDQDKKDVGDRVYGGSSGMITTWQNKIYPLFMMDREDGTMLETTILGINQARAVIDGSPRGPKTRPAAGAYSWQHAQLANVELKFGDTIWADSAHTKKAGRVVKWDIRKGKAGTHDGLRGEYDWYHIPEEFSKDPVFWSNVEQHGSTFGIDTITDLVETSRRIGAIDVAGSWLRFGDIQVQGSTAFSDLVVNDAELEENLRAACLEKANLTVRYN